MTETKGFPLSFHVFRGEDHLRSEHLTQDVIKIGKLPSNHLVIEDENVSRMHAVIEVHGPDDITIIDLGSTQGTFVNGQRVNKCKLEQGDEIVLGETKLVLEIGEAEEAVAGSPAAVQAPSAPAPFAPPVPAPFAPPAAAPFAPPAFAPPAAAAPGAMPFGAAGLAPPPFAAQEPAYDPSIYQPGPLDLDQVEVRDGSTTMEVTAMWGDMPLAVAHLAPGKAYTVGEDPTCDEYMPSEVLRTEKLTIVTSDGALVIPQNADGDLTVNGQTTNLREMVQAGRAAASGEQPGAHQVSIPAGGSARLQVGTMIFIVRPVPPGKRPSGAIMSAIDFSVVGFFGASFALHFSFLALVWFMPPAARGLSLDLLGADSRYVRYLIEPPEMQEEEVPEWLTKAGPDEDEGGKGKRHKGEEGQMGKQESKKTDNHYGIKGPEDNPDPHMAREAAKESAKTAGILGILRSATGSWNAPTSPYGRDSALGNDAENALGALMGNQLGENFGYGGLGLRGTGRGGGGTGEGTIGLGNLNTIGRGGGGGSGSGYGRGAGGLRGRGSRVPTIRPGAAEVRGSLSKEVIRRVVRSHMNEIKFCYEQQLAQRPDLAGRVSVQFIISPSGAVQSSSMAGSTLANATAEQCMVRSVRRWAFPAPEGGGIVVVTYPFMLQSANEGAE